MHTFIDMQKRAWPVEITVAAVRRVRDLCDVNVLHVMDKDSTLFGRLQGDPVLLVAVLFATLKPHADALNVTEEDFSGSIGGDVLDAAGRAFFDALSDFLPQADQREAMRSLLKKTDHVTKRLIAHNREQIDSFDPDAPSIGEILAAAEAHRAEAD